VSPFLRNPFTGTPQPSLSILCSCCVNNTICSPRSSPRFVGCLLDMLTWRSVPAALQYLKGCRRSQSVEQAFMQCIVLLRYSFVRTSMPTRTICPYSDLHSSLPHSKRHRLTRCWDGDAPVPWGSAPRASTSLECQPQQVSMNRDVA
jgi:hypothetical protein